MRRALFSAAVATGIVSFAACADLDSVVVIAPDGMEVLTAEVEIASTEEARARGLRGHDSLGPNQGLLIILPASGEVCVTNDGVAFPIDAVYISDSLSVVAVERAIPAGDATARCHEQTRYVLEVAGDAASAVSVGDGVRL